MSRIKLKSKCALLSIIILTLLPAVAMAVDYPVTIDGNYDDWSDKPHTSVSHGGWNGKDVHSVALYLEGGRLYMHFKMNDLHGTKFQPNAMKLTINNNYTLDFKIRFKNSDNSINWGGNVNNLPVGNTLDLAVYDNHDKKVWLGDAAISVYTTEPPHKGDEAECFIDLESIKSFCNNISIDEMSTFTLSCPNIGKEDVTITGTSTAPFIGIAVTLAVVGLAVLLRKYKVNGELL